MAFPSEVGTPFEERNALPRFQAICEENDLPKLRLYDLRHTHASLLIHEGVHQKKISERLGHSSIKLTMDAYLHCLKVATRFGGKDATALRQWLKEGRGADNGQG